MPDRAAPSVTPSREGASLAAIRELYAALRRVDAARGLQAALQAVCDGVVQAVGFEVALLNVVRPDGTFETVAVSGTGQVPTELVGQVRPSDDYDREFEVAEAWGTLRFVPHTALPPEELDGWVPDIEVEDDPRAWHPLDALYAPLRGTGGDLVGMLSVDLPVDRRKPGVMQQEMLEIFCLHAGMAIENAQLVERLQRGEERLREREESFRLAFDGAGVAMGMLVLSDDGSVHYERVNQRMTALLGRSKEELESGRGLELLHPEDLVSEISLRRSLFEQVRADRSARPVVRREFRVRDAQGAETWVEATTAVVAVSEHSVRALDQIEDVTARRRRDVELRRRARQDPLTGLHNRGALERRLSRALERSRRTGRPGAVLFCDLDGFKRVNDGHGHAVGDRVLVTIAARLAAEVRDTDVVGRQGGDEFVVVAEDLTDEEALALGERIRQAVAVPVQEGARSLQVTASIGIARILPHSLDGADLLRAADEAMYVVKSDGRDGVHVMTPGPG